MSCWCGADTQQQDYPPFDYECTAVKFHDPFATITSAPAWMVDIVFDALPLLAPQDQAAIVAKEISQAVWAETKQRIKEAQENSDGFGPFFDAPYLIERLGGFPDELPREPRVIPSRTTDPATSHQAAATITVKANTQRARLLQAFAVNERMGLLGRPDGWTDEEAMESAPGVSPSSEFSKRCSELREAGLIEPTGETRTGSSGHQRIVSRITEAGRKVVASL